MIKEETIYSIPAYEPKMVPDWKRCEELEQERGEVTIQMLMREMFINYDKARKILMRWEGIKEARKLQKNLGRSE